MFETIKYLPVSFDGKGEVSGYMFTKVTSSKKAYMYQKTRSNELSYEVFERKRVNVCLDFATKLYSETDFKEKYPKSRDFGIWAWEFRDIVEAKKKFDEITNKVE